jgi:hypothetical protein
VATFGPLMRDTRPAAPPAVGNRRTRASFRRVLERIADRIDRQPVQTAEWTNRLLHLGRLQSRFRVHALWVAGSFARGAPSCGDLDLIAHVSVESVPNPGESVIGKAIVRRAPDVRLYVGTPEKNVSGIAFPEARLIWSEADRDWRAAIRKIREDPRATRFRRRADEIPLRPEQLAACDPRQGEPSPLDRMLDLRKDRVIDWRFIPSSTVDKEEIRWSAEAREYSNWTARVGGRKTREALRTVIGLLQRDDRFLGWERRDHRGLLFRLGGAEIRVGRPSINLEALDTLACSVLCLAPHHSRRGPNGIWIIERSERHPLELFFRRARAWYLCRDGDDGPSLIRWQSEFFHAATLLELFSKEREALRRAKEHDVAYATERPTAVAEATGRTLLRLISAADVIEIDDHVLPVTIVGALVARQASDEPDLTLATPQDVLAVLSRNRGPGRGHRI